MNWDVTPGAVALFFTTGLSLFLAGIVWGRNVREAGGLFAAVMLAVAEWCFVAGLEATAVPLASKLVWSKLEYVGNGATAALFLLFASRWSGRVAWLQDRRRWLTFLLPAAGIALAATNERHHLIWTSFTPGSAGSNIVIYGHGLGYFLVVGAIYAYIVSACILLALPPARPLPRPRHEARTILIAAAFPLSAGILYSIGIDPVPGLNLVPISFFFTTVVFLIGMGFFRVFDLIPAARDALVEEMPDAVLIVDEGGRIVDANPTAALWLGGAGPLAGHPAIEVFAPWPDLLSALSRGRAARVEVTLRDAPLLYVDARIAPVREPAHGRTGFFLVLNDITKRHESETTLQRANARLAGQLEQIVALQAELRDQAIRDPITGLFNRRYLDEALPRELARAAHERGTLSVAMIDIDHFKETNDRYGHREGDRLLALLGSLLRDRTRPGDASCRYGGEEFLVVLPGTSSASAVQRMDEIRQESVARCRAAGFADPPTLSIGVATFPEHAESDAALLRAADAALYRAKGEGRNRVCVAAARSG
jgi:diguanylate cyclase (GGDEF)-like protein/PAS domain S-box-containing protein